jgi:monoamine oxidase
MRTWGGTGALAALRRARDASRVARQLGCGIDEADEILAQPATRHGIPGQPMTRRGFLGAAAVVGASVVSPRVQPRIGPGVTATPRVVVVGAGIAGLGCAYRLRTHYGIAADIYEYDTRPGGRIRTLRGVFADAQTVEEHAEFINPEHTATLALARKFGLSLDNRDKYPAGTHPNVEALRFFGRPWRQASVNRDWHDWAWQLFHHAAFVTAPWPQLYNRNNAGGRTFDHMSVAEWIETYVPGGNSSDFGALCTAAVLDEYGGPTGDQSALNLVYLLGQDASTGNGAQPHTSPQLGGADEKWHIRGGNDQLITGILERLGGAPVYLGQRLVALRRSGQGYVCTFETGSATADVSADHVVLALPFTTLRAVDLSGVEIAPLHRVAIDEEPLGSNSKLFLQFDSRIWNVDQRTGNCYDDGLVQGGWEASLNQPGRAGILGALPGGESALEWGSRFALTDYEGPAPAPMVEAFLANFDSLFPGAARHYNGRSYYVWSPGDPHILGAYSYLKVGQYTGFNGIQGVREGNLHFAGEHTSVNFQGYIEGALRSGYRCADEIVSPR